MDVEQLLDGGDVPHDDGKLLVGDGVDVLRDDGRLPHEEIQRQYEDRLEHALDGQGLHGDQKFLDELPQSGVDVFLSGDEYFQHDDERPLGRVRHDGFRRLLDVDGRLLDDDPQR